MVFTYFQSKYCFFSFNQPPNGGLVNHTRRVCPEGSRGPEGCRSKKETRRQFWPKSRLKWPKLYAHVYAHVYTRIKRSVTGPLRGPVPTPFGVGTPDPEGLRYEHPRRGAHMCIGGPHRGLPYAHHPQRGWLKKKNITFRGPDNFYQKYCQNQLNVRLHLNLNLNF